MEEVYLDKSFLSIRLDRQAKCVLAEWKGFANSNELRAGSDDVLKAIREVSAALLIIDTLGSEGVTPIDQLWIRDTFGPSLAKAGIRRLAMVVPQRGLARVATDAIRTRTTQSLIVTREFSTVSEAIAWGID
ncbi:MAG: hypothetical protein QOI23_2718 [Chloroflexota bacterium]|nr:hypothetical protein [Chloroflexota bacterium]